MRSLSGSGTAFAVAAYGIWGFAPVYWKQLTEVGATEVLAHRMTGALAFATLLLAVSGQLGEVRGALRARSLLLVSSLLLGINGWVFLWAVETDRIVDTSLGYYLTPLANIAIGTVVFREWLTRPQWIAVLLAAAGVGYMAWDLGRLPWISLVLGLSFAVYGALRKYGGVSSIGGFVIEAAILTIPAVAYLTVAHAEGRGAWVRLDELPPLTPMWLLGCGVMTATPLLCFASAAKRLPLVAVGFFQYIAPTLSLGVAVWLYGEAFTPTHGVTFSLIWAALLIYTWDNVREPRTSPAEP